MQDLILDVAVANSRMVKVWKNTQLSWADILARMKETTRTPETVAEYKRMGKNQQADIKDVGAFVGGYCNGGSRSDIRHRSILALDADFAEPGLWDDFCMVFGNAGAMYSTHKHTPEKPRLRLVVPLARNVSPDEFQAIGRRIAATLGIDQFDDSTYQPQRCMFWPSTSIDGEYIFRVNDGPALDPDAVLATYTDWRDVSAWPMSSRVTEIARRDAARQADPLEKPGLVGAFCRAYSIRDAIAEFIPVYAPTSEPSRYTYTEGSTACGVIIYEDKFSYSFHGTDPASGQLLNAWDLVRVHRFGARDADVDPGTPTSKRPSWSAMAEFARGDTRVKSQILAERDADFDDLPAEADTDAWVAKLALSKDGSVVSSIENVVTILNHDPKLAARIGYDEFNHAVVYSSALPWTDGPGVWQDNDDAALRYYLERAYGISGKDKIFDAVNVVAFENTKHPVREYLDGCTWDDVPRLDTLLVDYLGAEDTPYTRAVTRKAMVAAVARIYNPGVKFDYMLTLQGRQGLGKSALLAKLGGRWFSDSFTTIQGKDAYDQLQGTWLMEVGELAGMRKAEAETIKLFLSKCVDRYRPAYGRRTQEFPRQCVFFGTTNENAFLRDATGNRRFWIVPTPDKPSRDIWEDLTPDIVQAIWAEAVIRYHEGEELFLPRDLEAAARRTQSDYEEENPKVGIVLDYLDRALPEGWDDLDLYARRAWLAGTEEGSVRRDIVSYVEIWAEALGGSPERIDRYAVKELSDIMCAVSGWTRSKAGRRYIAPYGRQRYFERVIE